MGYVRTKDLPSDPFDRPMRIGQDPSLRVIGMIYSIISIVGNLYNYALVLHYVHSGLKNKYSTSDQDKLESCHWPQFTRHLGDGDR